MILSRNASPLDAPDIYDFLFHIGMWWRIFYGCLRLILGLTLLRLIGTPLSDIFYQVMSHELIEDRTDFLIQTVTPLLEHWSFTVTYFLAAYLIFWGIVDIFLSTHLLRHNLWAFPVSLYFIGVFVLYGVYRFSHTHSLMLLFIICVDIILMWLIRREYVTLRSSALLRTPDQIA